MNGLRPIQDRTRILVGDTGLARLGGAHVLLAGLGGVGSYAAEALARAGVGQLTLVDHSIMMERAGSQLDPLLFKFFINMVGVFPIGTLVMLDSKELGLVYESDVVFADRPRIMIIIDSKGEKVSGPVVNLTEKDAAGRYLRSIMKTLDPNKYKVNLAEYLL